MARLRFHGYSKKQKAVAAGAVKTGRVATKSTQTLFNYHCHFASSALRLCVGTAFPLDIDHSELYSQEKYYLNVAVCL